MWTFDEARGLVSRYQSGAWAIGWNLCMGGGVVNKGYSDNDFDLVAVPVDTKSSNAKILHLFTSAGWAKAKTWELPCATCHWLEMDGKIVELLVMKCGQK